MVLPAKPTFFAKAFYDMCFASNILKIRSLIIITRLPNFRFTYMLFPFLYRYYVYLMTFFIISQYISIIITIFLPSIKLQSQYKKDLLFLRKNTNPCFSRKKEVHFYIVNSFLRFHKICKSHPRQYFSGIGVFFTNNFHICAAIFKGSSINIGYTGRNIDFL